MAETGAEVRELTRTPVRRSLNLQIDREISLLVGYSSVNDFIDDDMS